MVWNYFGGNNKNKKDFKSLWPFSRIIFTKKCTFITFSLVSLLILWYQQVIWTLVVQKTQDNSKPKVTNYFLDSSELTETLLVNMTSCKIPDLSPFHDTILQFLEPPKKHDCERTYGRLTYVNKRNLIINITAINNWGYSVDTISCCYQEIFRIEQTLENYDHDADSISQLSDMCHPLQNGVNSLLTTEFLKVSCYKIYFFLFHDLIYTNFHTISQPAVGRVKNKIKYWDQKESKKKVEKPPNVILIGMDSISRLSALRNLKMSRAYLQKIGAVELPGYTKVGENTFPNAAVFMSGYSTRELDQICMFSQWTPQDDCPYIWHQFSEANYLTVYLEDTPALGNYNYFKTGFVHPPADYYLRPFMQQVYQEKNFLIPGTYQRFSLGCAGPDRPFEKIGSYMTDLFDMAQEVGSPIFINSWQTSMAHDGLNDLKEADAYLENFLRSFNLEKNDSNTILFVLSDHGFRYGQFRETHIGWFEDKLPFISVYLPLGIRQKYPKWLEALEINSRRLVSPYDLYHSFRHILEEFSKIGFSDSTDGGGTKIPRKFGQSLFHQVSNTRTCSQAGVASTFCACYNLVKVSLDHPHLIKAADAAITHINTGLPRQCAQLKVDKIYAGAVDSDLGHTAESIVVVGFIAIPGNFRFEATVNFLMANNTYYLDADVLRTNAIVKKQVQCVDNAVAERFCYCDASKS